MKVQVIALKPLYHPQVGEQGVGAKFSVDEGDMLATYEKSGLLVRSVGVVAESEVTPVDLNTGTPEQLHAAWDLEMTPKAYLKQFPDGPHADLALRLLELSAETETPTGE